MSWFPSLRYLLFWLLLSLSIWIIVFTLTICVFMNILFMEMLPRWCLSLSLCVRGRYSENRGSFSENRVCYSESVVSWLWGSWFQVILCFLEFYFHISGIFSKPISFNLHWRAGLPRYRSFIFYWLFIYYIILWCIFIVTLIRTCDNFLEIKTFFFVIQTEM